MTKFKKRYVLGTGYPWAIGTETYKNIALARETFGVDFVPINFPTELWSKDLPQYRLVLERVEKDKK